MAILHKEYNGFNSNIKLTQSRIDSLNKSKKEIRKKIRDWFSTNKPEEIQPKFGGQGSFMMGTGVNPIVKYDDEGNIIRNICRTFIRQRENTDCRNYVSR